MGILTKYKSNFDSGFKEFVKSLDLLPTKDMKELISNGLLEDPVYIKWALENKLGLEHFLKLNKEDVLKVFHELGEAPELVFLRALKNHPEETGFINANLPSLALKHYMEDRESAKITVAMQADARSKIMKQVFNLKESGDLAPFHWKLPSAEVLHGTSHTIDKAGIYKQYYENGVLAITGVVNEKTLRIGLWQNFYPNGSLHAEGSYTDDKKEDEWKIYYLNGNLKSSGCYKNNMKNGEWKEFEINNEFKTIKYVNGKVC